MASFTLGCCAEWGTAITWAGGDELFLHNRDYGLRRYRISTNVWETMSPPVFPCSWTGSTLTWGGGDYLYLNNGWDVCGGPGTGFRRYSLSGGTWETLTPSPARIGSGMGWDGGDFIYGRTGFGSTDFLRYSISGNVWENLGSAPVGEYAGNYGLAWLGGCVYTAHGRNKTFADPATARMWRYCPDGAPIPLDTDGDGVSDPNDNCPRAYNPEQADLDADGTGDPCDPDDDGDAVPDELDRCPAESSVGADADGNGCVDRLADLGGLILGLGLRSGAEQALMAKVDAALKAAAGGRLTEAANVLGAFINQLEAQAGKSIPRETAEMLITFARNAIAALGG